VFSFYFTAKVTPYAQVLQLNFPSEFMVSDRLVRCFQVAGRCYICG